MTLDELRIGKTATILKVNGEGALRHRLLDMGLTPRTEVMVRKMAPLGDPIELCLRGYELTIRKADAKNIDILACGNCADCIYHGKHATTQAHKDHSCAVRDERNPRE